MSRGVWLLPSRGRPERLARFAEAAIRCKTSTPGWVLINEADSAHYERVTLPDSWKLKVMESQGMGDKFREVWAEVRSMDWVGWLVDDVVPMTEKWDTVMLSGLNGKNVISCNDGARAPFRMCAPVFSGDLLRAVGYIYAPGFWHTYMDDAWERIGTVTGCWWVCMDVMLKHEDAFQTGHADATHVHSYGKSAEDQAAFEVWRMNGMDAAVLAVLNLMRPEIEQIREVACG